jgi:hypothetical protein
LLLAAIDAGVVAVVAAVVAVAVVIFAVDGVVAVAQKFLSIHN